MKFLPKGERWTSGIINRSTRWPGLGHSYAMRASVSLSKSYKTSEISDSRMMLTYKIHCFSHMMTDRAICRCCLCLYSLQLIHYGFRVYPKLIAPFTVQRRRYLTDPLSAVDVDDGSSHQVAVRRSQENVGSGQLGRHSSPTPQRQLVDLPIVHLLTRA